MIMAVLRQYDARSSAGLSLSLFEGGSEKSAPIQNQGPLDVELHQIIRHPYLPRQSRSKRTQGIKSSVSCKASTLSGLIGHPYRSRKWSIEGAVGLQVEPAVEVAPPGAGKHQVAAAGSTGQHSANICGRTGLGDIQAGKLRRRSTKVQQEPEQ